MRQRTVVTPLVVLLALATEPHQPAVMAFLAGGMCLVLLPFVGLEVIGAPLPRRLSAPVLVLPPAILAGVRLLHGPPWMLACVAGLGALIWLAADRICAHPIAAVELAALLIWLHVGQGTFRFMKEGTERLQLGLFAATWILSAALLLPWTWRIVPRDVPRARAIVPLAAAALLLVADRTHYVGLYPRVHAFAEITALLALDAALSILLARARIPAAAGAAVLAAGAAAFVLWRGPAHLILRSEIAAATGGPALLALHPARPDRALPAGVTDDPRLHVTVPRSPATDYDILLVTIDALRADAVGPRAPNLEKLAASGTTFTRAIAAGSRTAIGMGALLTGVYGEHLDWKLWPVDADGRLSPPPGPSRPAGFDTIPEIPAGGTIAARLAAAGLETIGAPSLHITDYFAPGTGLEQGFTRYTDLAGRWRPPDSDHVVDFALSQLDAVDRKSRWFMWTHLFDPHAAKGGPLDYWQMVTSADAALGKLLAGLEARGLKGRTVVIVTADHGEALGEHRQRFHGTSLYDEQIRVPLVVFVPGRAPAVVDVPASTVDVSATILALAGADATGIDGVDLLSNPPPRPIFSEIHWYRSADRSRTIDEQAAILGDEKLIYDRQHETLELFDLSRDPGEKTNLLADRQDRVADLARLLAAFLSSERPLP
jgi:arylsulfatase A-like enzyme